MGTRGPDCICATSAVLFARRPLAQLALQAGYPVEAKKVLDQGYAAGMLGKGSEAARQKRLSTPPTWSSALTKGGLRRIHHYGLFAGDGR